MDLKRLPVCAVAVLAIMLSMGFTPSVKGWINTEGIESWWDRYAISGGSPIVNDCSTAQCIADYQAALLSMVHATDLMFRRYPDVAFTFTPTVIPPGHTAWSKSIETRGLIDSWKVKHGSLPSRYRPIIAVDRRPDVIILQGRPWSTNDPVYNRSAQGCPHGTISHDHIAGESGATANRCKWQTVGMCEEGQRKDRYCRCYGSDGQMDGDSSCVAALDSDCPGSRCVPVEFNPDWIRTMPTATANAFYDDFRTLRQSGDGRIDGICDGTSWVDEKGSLSTACSSPPSFSIGQANAIPAASGRKADYYFYATYYDFSQGTTDLSVNLRTKSPLAATGGSYTTVTANFSPAPGVDAWVGGKAYIRIDKNTWEMRTITANTATSVTVGGTCGYGARVGLAGFCTGTVAGEQIGILSPGATISKRADISGVMIDLSNVEARKWIAAVSYAPLWDLQVPSDWPVVVVQSTKMGMHAKPWPAAPNVAAPCSRGAHWEERNDFELPTPAGGEGKCAVGESYYFGWQPALHEWESQFCEVALRTMEQMAHNAACTATAKPWACCTGAGTGTCPVRVPWENAKFASVSAHAANRFGPGAIDGNVTWGICPEVLNHPMYEGTRVNTRSEADVRSFPFVPK